MIRILSAIVLFGLMSCTSSKKETEDFGALFESHFKVFATQLDQREGAVDPTLVQAVNAYNRESWEEATQLLDLYLMRDSVDQEALLYRGVAKLAQGNQAEAQLDLLEIIDGTPSAWIPHAEWYATLGLVRNGEIEKAKINLEIMNKTEGYMHREEAAHLLEALPKSPSDS